MATMRASDEAVAGGEAALDAMIEQDPRRPGRHHARLVDYGDHVWAVIGTLQRLNWDIAKTAAEWHLPETAVRAAVRYYERNRELIDAYLLLQHEEYNSG